MEAFRPYVDYLVFTENPKELTKELKYKLIDLSNLKVVFDQEYYLSNAIKLYVNDVINALNTLNPNIMDRYKF